MSRGASVQPPCRCLPDSSMPFTDCVLLWSDGGRRQEVANQVFKLLSELTLEFSSRHAERSKPVFEKVAPNDFRMLTGNHGNETKRARKVENDDEDQLVASIICEHKRINGCCVTRLSVCAKSCRHVGSRMMLTLAHIASQL